MREIARHINIPFTVGGGIGSLEDVAPLDAGADKVSINSAAVRRPELIDELCKNSGSQFIVVAIDARKVDNPGRAAPCEAPANGPQTVFRAKECQGNGELVKSCSPAWTTTAPTTGLP